MTIHFIDDVVVLGGTCSSDQAEQLLQLLLAHPNASIDWRHVIDAHTAIVQILIGAERRMVGPPNSDFLRNMVAPLLMKS